MLTIATNMSVVLITVCPAALLARALLSKQYFEQHSMPCYGVPWSDMQTSREKCQFDCEPNTLAALATGNYITAAAHIVTAVIGSGVLSLAWATSTMGWIAGPIVLLLFSAITWYCAWLLADAYRHPRDTGVRTYTYPGAVSTILGMCEAANTCSCLHNPRNVQSLENL